MKNAFLFWNLVIGSLLASSFVFAQQKEIAGSKFGEFEVEVRMLNDSVYRFVSDLYVDKDTDKPYVFRNTCEQIFADQTRGIRLKDESGLVFEAKTIDGFWLFPIHEGKLGLYKTEPKRNQFKFLKFTKGGKLYPYSFRNAKMLFADANAVAKKEFRAFKVTRFAEKVMLYGGGAAIALGLFAPLNDIKEISSQNPSSNVQFVVYGTLSTIISQTIAPLERFRLFQAVEYYNRSNP